MNKKLKVIIRCLVYNHEPYLRDCLEGFIMQKTNFPFKAVVHDDCSTDASAAIIREYAEKYPDIIEPIYETENQYSKRDGSLKKIMDEATLNRSDYVAYCEGDDYWTDPYKLQKQIDFLDNNSEYSMCFTSCKIEYQYKERNNMKGENIEDRDYSATELYKTWTVPTASICLRESVLHHPKRKSIQQPLYGDIIIVLICALAGKIRGFKFPSVVYRVHAAGITNREDIKISRTRRYLKHCKLIMKEFPNVDRQVCKHIICQAYLDIIKISHSKLEKLYLYILAGWYHPTRMIKMYKDIILSYLNR